MSKYSVTQANKLATYIYEKRVSNGTPKHPQSLREAAKECGTTTATLSRVECGSTPTLETFYMLCLWLGVSADVLLGLKEEEK